VARHVARMLVILPFETRFYQAHRVPAIYVGNPLADAVRGVPSPPARALSGVLALLPGSRAQEIRRLWPPMLAAARLLKERLPRLRLVVPVAPTIDRALLGDAAEVELVDGRAPEVLARADAAIVASGTATLEAALALTPMVVVYRASWLTWWIGRMLVRVKFLSLVNLISGRAVVPELLQRECIPERIAAAVEPLLSATPARTAQLDALRAIRAELAPEGSPPAARRAADEIAARDSRVRVLHRSRKEGLGRAYLAGFAEALRGGYGRIVEMDADFSHDPGRLPALLGVDADLVLGSRYVPGGGTVNWGPG